MAALPYSHTPALPYSHILILHVSMSAPDRPGDGASLFHREPVWEYGSMVASMGVWAIKKTGKLIPVFQDIIDLIFQQ